MSYQSDIRTAIARRITNSLKENKIPWRYGKRGIPTNVVTGAKYTGINPIILNAAAEKYNFVSKYWGTKLQWQQADANVLSKPRTIDEEDHGVKIVQWQENNKMIETDDRIICEKFPTLKSFEVFNAKQVVGGGIGCCFKNESKEEFDYTFADEVIKQSHAVILHIEGLQIPHYDRELDEIILPERNYFLNDSQYYATAFHELAHFAESRTSFYGPEVQGELVAEIVTGTLEAFCELPHDNDLTNYNKYLQEWIEKIDINPKYLFDAAAAAARSFDWISKNVQHLIKQEEPMWKKMLFFNYLN